MGIGQPRRRSGRRGARPRKSKRRMRRAVAMQPMAHCGRLGAEMPCVVDALDRPAAVVSCQFVNRLPIMTPFSLFNVNRTNRLSP